MPWLLRHPNVLLALSLTLLVAGIGGCVAWYVFRPVILRVPNRIPAGFPENAFDHGSFEALLTRFVDADGQVDYEAWAADKDARVSLDTYLGAVARFSPTQTPERFPSESDRLAYWLYAYNACVLKGVLENWPLKSVRDVEAPLNVVAGLGFFGKLQFVLGGETMSLHHLEQGVVRKRFADPRIHFVLNCASGGCPVMRPELPTGDALEPSLVRAARDFVADPANVVVDHEQKVLRLSQIFDWYREDFAAELTRRGLPAEKRTLAAYVHLVADGERKVELERALAYRVEFLTYDWDLNSSD